MGSRIARLDRTVSGDPVAWPVKAAPDRARERRNSYSISGYTGINGGGKTMCAVYDSMPALAAGRPIVSTCRILDPRTGDPHPLWVPLDDYRLLLDVEFCDVILDEVTGIASSRDSASLPSAVLNSMMQLRKRDVTVRWTTPNWKRADTAIREVTQALTTCTGLAPVDRHLETEDGLVRRWRQRRAFVWRTYDAQMFDEWSSAKERSKSSQYRIRPKAREVFWLPGRALGDMYDTYETALSLGATSEHGLCFDCGGSRPRKKCTCDPSLPNKDDSYGMRLWREVDARRRRPLIAELAETDDTPGVLIESHPDYAANVAST